MGVSTTQAIYALVPETDVAIRDGRRFSLSNEPWLRLETRFSGNRFLEIAYRASLLDDPVRPILRFVTDSGPVDRILPGPVAGAGVWRGAAPKGIRAILISPTNRPGRFEFQIESVKPVGLLEMLADVWRRKPKKLWSFFIPTLFGFVAEAENALDWASNSEPLDNFESWRAPRERAFDRDGLDAPRFPWPTGPLFAIIVHGDETGADALSRTIDSARGQIYERWRLIVVTGSAALRERFESSADRKILFARPDDAGEAVLQDADFVAFLRAGDELAPQALACFAEETARAPQARLLYADEIVRTDVGDRPTFKPNWSPVFEAARPYLGRCVFWGNSLRRAPDRLGDCVPPALDAASTALRSHEVAHLRRWLMSRDDDETVAAVAQAPSVASSAPSVSIILLTRDRPDILGPCIDSVLQRSTHPSFELIVVDNGSSRDDTQRILDSAAKDERVRIVKRPGPFNFAALNNDAARSASGETLVFLNNDTVVVSGDWLEQLARQAVDPAAGAVGALLLFPDGRVQHAGVVVGLGQDAGHFGALAPPDAPSWLDRVRHLHETSAVTAACMAVERRKFEAVGGFDTVNLPIEFNDTDLCLRLAERGWTSRYVPTVRLIHLESATRGNAMFRPMSVYAKERDYFRRRWRSVIRDDPFYHPALSLYARHPALW
ncbi:MAG: glycosyl transferase family 2 [Methylocystaceae bacterium]|nr:MAG: glycosyl transferase family 2 [Methylocystaceae bacterium]